MKIKEVSYSKTFGIPGIHPFEKIMLIGELEEGDTARESLYILRKQAHDFHFESNKAAEKQAKEVVLSGVPKIIADIYATTSMEDDKGTGLLSFKLLAENMKSKHPEILAAYEQQLNKLNGLQ